MPERIDGLTRTDVHEILEIYARTNDLRELRELGRKDSRFRAPAFHAMLRQEHIGIRSRTDLDEKLKEGILLKYHFFFACLHHDAYGERVRELAEKIERISDLPLRPGVPDPRTSGARSATELALWLVTVMFNSGKLQKLAESGNIEIPLLVDRADPLAVVSLISPIAEEAGDPHTEQLLLDLRQRATDVPGNRPSLAASLLFYCLRCGHSFADLHRYFIDGTDRTEFADPITLEISEHSCLQCRSIECCVTAVLADEAGASVDPLLASSCLIIPNQHHRIFIPPPLTVRNERDDRILEARLSELEQHGEKCLGRKEYQGMTMYHLAYTRAELETLLTEAGSVVVGVGDDLEHLNEYMGKAIVDEVIRKVASGILPLDMAMEHVRRMAQARPGLCPPIPVYSDIEGSPEQYLTAILVTRAIYEESQGKFDLKALLSVFASEAYRRVGAEGLARTELDRARAFRAMAEAGGVTDLVDRMLLQNEADQAMQKGRPEEGIAKLEQLVERAKRELIDPPQTPAQLESAFNYLGVRNRLGVAYSDGQRLVEAFRVWSEVESSAAAYAASPLLEAVAREDPAREQERDGTAAKLRSSFRYLQSGALANQGWVCRRVGGILNRLFGAGTELASFRLADVLEVLQASREEEMQSRDFRDLVTATLELLGRNADITCERAPEDLLTQSIQKYRCALEISEGIHGHSFAAIQANTLYELYRDTGHTGTDEMESCLRAAIRHARKSAMFDVLTRATASLSQLQEQSGAIAEAADLSETAMKLVMQRRVASGLDEVRESLGEMLLDIAARTARLRTELQQPVRVLEAIESAKCSLLSIDLERSPLRWKEVASAEPSIQELCRLESVRERAWATISQGVESASRMLQPEDPPQSANPAEDLESIDARIGELQQGLRLRHPRFDAWCRWSTVAPFELADIMRMRQRWREPGRIVGFFVRNGMLWWYQTYGEEVRTGEVRLGSGGIAGLNAQIVRLRGHVLRDELSLVKCQDVLESLSNLLAPAFLSLPHATGAHTVICPHESLLWLPWPLLPVGGQLLVEAGPIFMTPGLGVISRFQRGCRLHEHSNILVVADPQQGSDDALPGAAREAQALRVRFDGRCHVLEGKAASLEAVLDAAMGKSILHFCCHGSFGGFKGDVGRLLLAATDGQNGAAALSCSRIVESLDLSETALVNLAACDSGLVRPDQGTEIDGIARAFLAAGASAVLGSLWPIEDDAAAIFSDAFYSKVTVTLEAGLALQRTQVDCLNGLHGPQMTRRQNWAGYMLVGAPPETDPAPIPEGAIVV